MTDDEAAEWLNYHAATFAIGDKLKKAGEETRSAWYRVVLPLKLADAKAATDKMFAESDLQPYRWQNHPGAIRRLAYGVASGRGRSRAAEGPRFIDGEEVFDCPICLDYGAFSVWQDQSIKAMQRGEFGQENARSWAVACTCRSGDLFAKRIRRFDSRRDVKCLTTYDEESIAALRERYEGDGAKEFDFDNPPSDGSLFS